MAPTQHLSPDERKALIKVQESQFDNEEQMNAETTQMKQAIKSETVTEMTKANEQHQQAHDPLQEALRNMDEAAIAQEQETGEIYE